MGTQRASKVQPAKSSTAHSSLEPAEVEKSAMARSNPRFFWIVFGLIVIVAIWLRTQDLALRPMHNDEGVNYHFVKEIGELGVYPYSHENYHGPAYFYLLKLSTDLLGISEHSMRLPTVIFGVLSLFLLLPLRKFHGERFVLIASLLLALSSSLIFNSRYAIHETLFLFATVWFGVQLYLWCSDHAISRLYHLAVAFALLLSTKETWILNLFCVGLGILLLGRWREQIKFILSQRRHLFFSFLLFIILLIGIFTGGFQWIDGIREMLLAIPQWVNRSESDVGHHKPFVYYLYTVITQTEFHLPILCLVSVLTYALLAAKRGRVFFRSAEGRFGIFLGVWAFASLLTYSFVPYKTPWLVINITFPMILLAAWGVDRAFEIRNGGILVAGLLTILGALSAFFLSLYFNFRTLYLLGFELPVYDPKPYGNGNPFSYVHTTDGMLKVVSQIKQYEKQYGQARILIGVAQYWPMPFYLRDEAAHVAYLRSDDAMSNSERYDIMVLNDSVVWDSPEWSREYHRLSDVQECNLYMRKHP